MKKPRRSVRTDSRESEDGGNTRDAAHAIGIEPAPSEVSSAPDFDRDFHLLTGNSPFPWQRALFKHFAENRIPRICDLPTGLGKTSVIAIWLLALAWRATRKESGLPRRLVYVVNRRTVVDQATREVERMRDTLAVPGLRAVAGALQSLAAVHSDVPLAVSTLRGQHADNAEWRNDPARAAVVVGTVDMIGSRLLFSGYGCGFKSKPLHAGFLGQDALLVHDEAHLEPAFQELIETIEKEQVLSGDIRPLRVMALTATSRSESDAEIFRLTADDLQNEIVLKRVHAKKGVSLHVIDEEKLLTERIAKLALEHEHQGEAILVFVRKVEDVERIKSQLPRDRVQTLTGTLRGYERDRLLTQDPVFVRFMPPSERKADHEIKGTVYLVCTSAGEVGINISADHLVSDLTPFDSMAQRFGRVNRFGDGDARVDIVFAPLSDEDLSPWDAACERTRKLLESLPLREDGRRDASPKALGGLDRSERQAAFTPPPVILPVSDILLDAWTLTTIRGQLPTRPPVAMWLHGISNLDPPETLVAWREEVEVLEDERLRAIHPPDELLADYPLKPHELLRDRTDRVLKHLKAIADRRPDDPLWILDAEGSVSVLKLQEAVERDKSALNGCTVILPPRAGGLLNGCLDGRAEYREGESYDVSAEWFAEDGSRCRIRTWDDCPPPEMRLIRSIDRLLGDEDAAELEEEARYWSWYVRPQSADDDGSRSGAARAPQSLDTHLEVTGLFAADIVERLGLGSSAAVDLPLAIQTAARFHDLGKNRAVWQRSIGNLDYPRQVLAKSGTGMRPLELTSYRHELGSLLDIVNAREFDELAPEIADLSFHVIACHHGRARPHFPSEEAFDPERDADAVRALVNEVPRRFERLQRRYGRWGLAYLESLMRAADALASQPDQVARWMEQSRGQQ